MAKLECVYSEEELHNVLIFKDRLAISNVLAAGISSAFLLGGLALSVATNNPTGLEVGGFVGVMGVAISYAVNLPETLQHFAPRTLRRIKYGPRKVA